MNDSSLPVPLEAAEATAMAPSIWGTTDPAAIVKRAAETAGVLADVLRAKKLTKRIGQKEHVLVEGWTLLGSMLGVFPVCVWTRPLEDGWEARVEARTVNGNVVGAAEACCTRSEPTWSKRDEYALRSMAQTRAASKALRQPLGFVVVLAGYEATPADEMPSHDATRPHQGAASESEPLTDTLSRSVDGKRLRAAANASIIEAFPGLSKTDAPAVYRKIFGTDDRDVLRKMADSDYAQAVEDNLAAAVHEETQRLIQEKKALEDPARVSRREATAMLDRKLVEAFGPAMLYVKDDANSIAKRHVHAAVFGEDWQNSKLLDEDVFVELVMTRLDAAITAVKDARERDAKGVM